MAPIGPLLTIAIPTYNRAKFLNRVLVSLGDQMNGRDYPIELIVSDNCSTDHTPDIVNKAMAGGLLIRYIRNSENKGPDLNIAQCYLEAKGKYVLTFGDDDIFLPGAIHKIIRLLSEKEYGIVFLKSKILVENSIAEIQSEELDFTTYNKPLEFIKRVNHNFTFISSNIVNTKYLNKERLIRHVNSYLIQISFILDSALLGPENVYVNTILIAAEPDNSGGYGLFKVFGENFANILKGYDPEVRRLIQERLILEFFPYWILHLRTHPSGFNQEDSIIPLRKAFSEDLYYKIFLYPLAKLPIPLAKIHYRVIGIYNRIYKKMNQIK